MTKMADETLQSNFVYTGATVRLLEQIAASIKMNEPVLLVGETGTGKTTAV
jgi:midasin